MKAVGEFGELKPLLLRISAVAAACLAAFFFGKHWSSASYPQLPFYPRFPVVSSFDSATPYVAISPNAHFSVDVSSLISSLSPPLHAASPAIPSHPPPPPPPPPQLPERIGVVDDEGNMRDDFDVGALDSEVVDVFDEVNGTSKDSEGEDTRVRVGINKFKVCPSSMSEYIPCLDNVEAIERLQSTIRGEKFERHCPEQSKGLNCLVQAPKDYKTPIPWPRSRDEVFFLLTCFFRLPNFLRNSLNR